MHRNDIGHLNISLLDAVNRQHHKRGLARKHRAVIAVVRPAHTIYCR
jgi:hypothetical protein